MKLAFFIALMTFGTLSVRADERPPEQVFKEWASSSEWLKLLHMKKSGNGHVSPVKTRPDMASFFLSEKGSQDPLAELKETYSLMFEQGQEKALKTQCRFLARRDFFVRHSKLPLKDALETCEFTQDWLGKLNTDRLSLIFASGYLNSAASSFGHTFLKLHNPNNQSGKELLDYGINFAARTADTSGALYALYGLFGFFPGSFGMTPYHQMIKEYTNLEGRDLWEYQLNLSKEEVERMLWHLLELEGSYVDYYFLDDNCSFEILKILEVARPGLNLAGEDELYVIPLDTVKRAEPLFVKTTYRPSLQTIWNYQKRNLMSNENQQIRSAQNLSEWNSETLSAGQTYYSLMTYEDHEKYKSLNYEISRERAKRGKAENASDEVGPPANPLTSHHSSLVQLGVIQSHHELKLLSGFRFAFHDELSRNAGLTPFSHLEVGGFQFEKSQLRRYRLIEMLSTESISSFGWPLSWGVKFGGDLWPVNSSKMQNFIEARGGWSFDLGERFMRLSLLATAGAKQDFDEKLQFVPGIEFQSWILWSEKIRTLMKADSQRYPTWLTHSWSVYQAVDLTNQLELRAGLRSGKVDEISFYENQISLQQNF